MPQFRSTWLFAAVLLLSALPVAAQSRKRAFEPPVLVGQLADSPLAEQVERPQPEDLPVPPQGEPLSLVELEQMALSNNPALAAAQARIQQAEGVWLQVGLRNNPSVGYVGEEMGAEGSAGLQGAMFSQTVITGQKRQLSRAVAEQQILAAQEQWQVQRLRVLTDVRLGYNDVLVAQRRLEVTQQLVTLANQSVQTVEDLLRAQERSRIELLQARVEQRSAQILLENNRYAYTAAWRQLTAVLGTPGLAPRPLDGQLDAAETEYNWQTTLDRLLQESPEVGAALAEVQRARWSIQRAQAEVVPDVSLQVQVLHDNGSSEDVTSLQASFPVPLFNRNQGGRIQARADLVEAQRTLERVELSLQNRLAAVFQQYAAARNQVHRYSEQILPDAEETLSLVTAGYRAGELDYLNLLTVQRTYFQTSLAYLEALGQLNAAAARIEGLLLSGSLAAN